MIPPGMEKDEKTDAHQGYTLIEVLIAMAIFSIGILALFALQFSSTNGNASAGKRTLALTWTQDRIEKLAETPFSDATLNAGNYAPPAVSDGIDNNTNGRVDEAGETGNYNISWSIADMDLSGDGLDDAKTIRVQVSWSDRGRSRSTYLNFIKIDI